MHCMCAASRHNDHLPFALAGNTLGPPLKEKRQKRKKNDESQKYKLRRTFNPPAKFDGNRVHPWVIVAASLFSSTSNQCNGLPEMERGPLSRMELAWKIEVPLFLHNQYIKIICCLLPELPVANCQGQCPAVLPSSFRPSFSATGSLPHHHRNRMRQQQGNVHVPNLPYLSCRRPPAPSKLTITGP